MRLKRMAEWLDEIYGEILSVVVDSWWEDHILNYIAFFGSTAPVCSSAINKFVLSIKPFSMQHPIDLS